jgi:hypothetical protein
VTRDGTTTTTTTTTTTNDPQCKPSKIEPAIRWAGARRVPMEHQSPDNEFTTYFMRLYLVLSYGKRWLVETSENLVTTQIAKLGSLSKDVQSP